IVSGLAIGIDAAAHRGGLAGASSTIAVLGTGIDVVYPKRNAELVAAIAERGLLISEFPLGTAPLAHNFPRRNRLISGLAQGCLGARAGMSAEQVSSELLRLELDGRVTALPGGLFQRLEKGKRG